ncbi:MAG: nucleoid-associated protein [Verrucomicrobiales bacterium]|nr:nucleoid-associated protein [Verrucomicrobiales bacterium]
MAPKVHFKKATLRGIVLAKVGNPARNEPLTMSREVFHVRDEDQRRLMDLFTKPFKNLLAHRFHHHSNLSQNEVYALARGVFASADELLASGCDIAKRLYSKSGNANIKSGDLCVALMDGVRVEGETVSALCILKSESVTPFISITVRDGDLELTTQEGIHPEKIDKGALVLDVEADSGLRVQTFDRSGESRFWFRDFLGVQPVTDGAFLTNAYANMATTFLAQEHPPTVEAPEEAAAVARQAMAYFDDRERFDLQEFEQEVLKSPEAVERFADFRSKVEQEEGQKFDTAFEISKKDVNKARRRIGAVLKLDTGVDIHLKHDLAVDQEAVLERGFDERRQMRYIKIFHHGDPEVQ